MHDRRLSVAEPPFSKIILWYVALYFIASLGMHFAFFPIGDIGVESDFYGELVIAAKALQHHDFSVTSYPVKGPFYSLALIAVRFFLRDWYLSGVVLSALCAVASLLVAFRLLSRLFGRSVAFLATIAMSLASDYFALAHKASSDMLFLVLCLLSIDLLLTERFVSWRFILAGVLGTCAFLTRYIGVFLPFAAVLAAVVNPWRGSRGRAVAVSLLYVGAFLASCAPWFILSFRETGSVLYTGSAKIVAAEMYQFHTASGMPEGGFDSILDLLAHAPGSFAARYVQNVPVHLWLDMYKYLGGGAGILFLLGVARLFFAPPTRMQWAFLLSFALYFLACCAVFYLARYSLLLSTAYFALASSFVINLADAPRFLSRVVRSSRRGKREARSDGRSVRAAEKGRGGAPGGHPSRVRIVTAVIVCVVLLLEVAAIVASESFYYKQRPLYLLDAARFLKGYVEQGHGSRQDVVMARKPHVAYYADLAYQQYPLSFSLPRGIIAYARSRGIGYLVCSSVEMRYFGNEEGWRQLGTMDGVSTIYSADSTTIYRVDR